MDHERRTVMSGIILPRRRFLFLAPAVIASASLMPVSAKAMQFIAPPVREFRFILLDPLGGYFGILFGDEKWVVPTQEEINQSVPMQAWWGGVPILRPKGRF